MVQVELGPAVPILDLIADPPLPPAQADALLARVPTDPPPVDLAHTLRLYIAAGGRTPRQALALHDRLPDAEARDLARFDDRTLTGRHTLLRHWAAQQALPVIGRALAGVDDQFAGVQGLGRRILDRPPGPVDLALAGGHPDYWRATVELALPDPALWLVRALALTANGHLHHARLLTALALRIHPPGTPAHELLVRLAARLDRVHQPAREQIARGVAEHDAGRYDAAIAHYDAVLAADPHHPLARYERALSEAMRQGGPDHAVGWAATRAEIDRHSPLAPDDLRIQQGPEMFRFVRRREFHEALAREPASQQEAYTQLRALADAALELDVDVLAGLLYRHALSVAPDDAATRDTLHRLAYAAHRQGATLPIALEPDAATALAAVDAEVRRAIAEHPAHGMRFTADAPAAPADAAPATP